MRIAPFAAVALMISITTPALAQWGAKSAILALGRATAIEEHPTKPATTGRSARQKSQEAMDKALHDSARQKIKDICKRC